MLTDIIVDNMESVRPAVSTRVKDDERLMTACLFQLPKVGMDGAVCYICSTCQAFKNGA